ncbi:MAG: anaerobic sulfatase maturase, partial [Deltaproteobacteria bacterium]|nr:anaerobic sulfatase maturase [Deltaproteobacteria bacterium]
GSRFQMDERLLEIFTRQYIESQPFPEITFSWQGGEPTLMGLDFFKKAIQLQQRYARPGTRIINTLQTNGTLLDEKWCLFFKKYGFLIGLSMDGPEEIHDTYRVNRAGKGSFNDVIKGWQMLHHAGVQYNILCCVHAASQDKPLEVYHFFRDELNAQFIQFIPIVERARPEALDLANSGWREPGSKKRVLYTQSGNRVTERSVSAPAYGDFLVRVFDEWVKNDVGNTFVQIFDVALGAWADKPGGLCVFSPACGNAMALEHNGDLFSCDHFVEPEYLLGNIKKKHIVELAASERQREFGELKRKALPEYCLKCDALFACHGGCIKNRFINSPDGEPGLNYLCGAYKKFFNHIDRPMKTMARLIRQRRPASEVMEYMT